MSRYYRTSMGDDPATATTGSHADTKTTPDEAPRPRKHASRPRSSAPTSTGADAGTSANAPPIVSARPPSTHPATTMPLRRSPPSKERDKSTALLKEEVSLSKANRRLLLIGGAAAGLGVLVLLLGSGGGDRSRSR